MKVGMPHNLQPHTSDKPVTGQAATSYVSALEPTNMRSQITQNLRAAMLAGEMKVGQIYSAPALALQFGVSATPVREAMIDLAKEGIVEVVRNKGFRITLPSVGQLRQMMEVRLLLEVPTIRDIAARGLSLDQQSAARHLAEASLDAARHHDLVAHVAADIRFHLYLLTLSGNQEIVDIVRILRSRGRLYGLQSHQKRSFLLDSAQEHLALVKLIGDRHSLQAAELMSTHIRRAGEEWSDPALEADLS